MRTCLLQTHSRVNEDLYQLTLPNHARYAGRHGYDMIQLHRTYEEVWWGIEDLILDLLPKYDAILTVGSDVVFTDMDRPLSSFDDGEHSVFVQEEGLGYPCINFDLVLWTKAEGVRHVIQRLRDTRPAYATHRFGLQTGMSMLAKDPTMSGHIKTYPPKAMQGAPFTDLPGTWEPGVFALHFLGMSNEEKYLRCGSFLATGEVPWRKR